MDSPPRCSTNSASGLSVGRGTLESNSLLSLRFPLKLWKIVNECQTGAIHWNEDGSSLVINYPKFQDEYLDDQQGVFKTANMASFIRQLNLYGFRKKSSSNVMFTTPPGVNEVHEFTNPNFIKGRKDLLSKVSRKPSTHARFPGHRTRSQGNTASRITKCQQALKDALNQQQCILASKGSHKRRSYCRRRIKGKENASLEEKQSKHLAIKQEMMNSSSNEWKADYKEDPEESNPASEIQNKTSSSEDGEKSTASVSPFPYDFPSECASGSIYYEPIRVYEMDQVLDHNIPPSICLQYEPTEYSLDPYMSVDSVFNRTDNTFAESIYRKLMDSGREGDNSDISFLFDLESDDDKSYAYMHNVHGTCNACSNMHPLVKSAVTTPAPMGSLPYNEEHQYATLESPAPYAWSPNEVPPTHVKQQVVAQSPYVNTEIEI